MIDKDKLNRWYHLTQQLDAIKTEELALRKELFGVAFPDPTEGSKENKMPINDGTGAVLQGDHKINRTLDQAVIATLAMGDNTRPLIDRCFDWQAKLKLGEFKKLNDDDLALISDAVTEKPGTPALKIVFPKRG